MQYFKHLYTVFEICYSITNNIHYIGVQQYSQPDSERRNPSLVIKLQHINISHTIQIYFIQFRKSYEEWGETKIHKNGKNQIRSLLTYIRETRSLCERRRSLNSYLARDWLSCRLLAGVYRLLELLLVAGTVVLLCVGRALKEAAAWYCSSYAIG